MRAQLEDIEWYCKETGEEGGVITHEDDSLREPHVSPSLYR
jgi:hypothetical protein